MTTNDRSKATEEWLKTVKTGDEVCVTNIYDTTRFLVNMFNSMVPDNLQNEKSCEDICMISTIRGVLEDGTIIVGDKLFTANGTLETNTPMKGNPSLHPATDELRQLTWRFRFYDSMKTIPWTKFDDSAIVKIIDIINVEIQRITVEENVSREETCHDENDCHVPDAVCIEDNISTMLSTNKKEEE